MPGASRARRWGSAGAAGSPVFLILLVCAAPRAGAIEALDGRVQLHGFGEVQMRALSRNLEEDLDLAQWYNVLNLELEVDVAPGGWGPMDLIQAYVRVEARYDCVWTRGCGMIRGATTYGDRAGRVPRRLRDASGSGYSGVIPPTPPGVYAFRRGERSVLPVPRIGDGRTAGLRPGYVDRFDIESGDVVQNSFTGVVQEAVPGEGLPGFEPFFAQRGADNRAGTLDDPYFYTFGRLLFGSRAPYSFALMDLRGPPGGAGTRVVGPWRPKNFIQANGLLRDRANPFRGGFAALTGDYRGGDPLDPELAALKALLGLSPHPQAPGAVPALTRVLPGDASGDSFAGDWSGVVPCRDPSSASAEEQRGASNPGFPFSSNCYPNLEVLAGGAAPGDREQPFANVRVAFEDRHQYVDIASGATQTFVSSKPGGSGELPMRPAPDLSNLAPASANRGGQLAQGLYVPSRGLQGELARGDLDDLDMNYDQLERSWNRGQSQQQTGELKEAYLDVEWLDGRLWTRVGKQSIVWGKTELFRTTDQFNPQDLALASLPSLEESRISLWALRAVYSFYDVGPLQDLRLEVAANFDEFQPADLGAAGEPFTPDSAGTLSNGIFFHSLTGVGIAGVDRPENPWDNIKGLEAGFRAEFRAGAFSFAISDFYGYHDFPYADRIWTYSRSNDLVTSRPLVGGALPRPGAALCTGPDLSVVDADGDGMVDRLPDPANGTTRALVDSKSPQSLSRLGIGGQESCLKGGGAGGFANADPVHGGAQNALQFHHANQQIYAWTCSLTIGIGASLDPGTCAWSIFGSPENLGGFALQVPFVELISAVSAGDRDSRVWGLLGQVISNTKGNLDNDVFSYPAAPLNRDPGPVAPDCPVAVGDLDPFAECARWDGVISMTSLTLNELNADVTSHSLTYRSMLIQSSCDVGIPNAPGFSDPSNAGPVLVPELESRFPGLYGRITRPGICAQFLFHHDPGDVLSLDSTLSNFQKALLGCGAFYGTRCDAAARIEVLPDGLVVDGADDAEAIRNLEDSIVLQHAEGGGIDLLNTEASALMQSWPGIEGTAPRAPQRIWWTSLGRRRQPGTVRMVDSLAFADGGHEDRGVAAPSCTRPDGRGRLVTLPGCAGIETLFLERGGDTVVDRIEISFEDGYRPSVDGCVVGSRDPAITSKALDVVGDIAGVEVRVVPNANGWTPDLGEIRDCHTLSFRREFRVQGSRVLESVERVGSGWLFHPLAGCLSETEAQQVVSESAQFNSSGLRGCGLTQGSGARGRLIRQRLQDLDGNGLLDIEDEFIGTLVRLDDVDVPMAQIFKSEMAALSFNFLQFLVVSSCSVSDENNPSPAEIAAGQRGNVTHKQECFDPERPLQADKCSFNAPQLCQNVKGFLAVAGVTRNDVRAGGNPRFGRRTFIWHSGGEAVLRYERRNVLGFSTDFAEDLTKSSWGVEFTWIEGLPFADADAFDNTSKSDALNLTVSVDRPTFLNFLNANRTFFLNTQWFFQYLPGYQSSFTSNGPWNVFFTFSVTTGYFQDRLQPSFVSIFDVQSRSGGFLPSISYRFTEALSATLGANFFFGRTQRTRMPLNELGTVGNRAPHFSNEAIAYQDGVDNGLSGMRDRDELYLRLRWSF